MKINWILIKTAAAVVVALAAVFWAAGLLAPQTYSGANITFVVRSGPVAVTNPSTENVTAQLVTTGGRAFSVSSTTEGITGTSTRTGTGSSSTQLFEFQLPPGLSEFTVTNGTTATRDVNFVASPDTRLDVVVQMQNAGESRLTLIVALVVIAIALFYISQVNEHRWLRTILRTPVAPVIAPIPVASDAGQGPTIRSYGDNRTDNSN